VKVTRREVLIGAVATVVTLTAKSRAPRAERSGSASKPKTAPQPVKPTRPIWIGHC
jgi:hypothetical protein